MSLLRPKLDIVQKVEDIIFPSTEEILLKKIQDILAEYNNMESDIPVTHDYWDLRTEYRRLMHG